MGVGHRLCFLSRDMNAQNQFESLMNQYSGEAAAAQERAERAAQRSRLIKSLIKTFFIIVLFAAAATAYVYRDPISARLSGLKMKSIGEMQAERKAGAESKAKDVQKQGEKRVQEVEGTLK